MLRSYERRVARSVLRYRSGIRKVIVRYVAAVERIAGHDEAVACAADLLFRFCDRRAYAIASVYRCERARDRVERLLSRNIGDVVFSDIVRDWING